MKIKQKFHDYCDGCPEMDLFQKELDVGWVGESCVLEGSCYNYELCARLWDRLSTIRNDPPDLMEQIAAICREKCISVDEAVELFRKL